MSRVRRDSSCNYNLLTICSQLYYDGYQKIAADLTSLLDVQVACAPSDRLSHIVTAGLRTETDSKEGDGQYAMPDSGIDLDFESESMITAPEPSTYETVYVTSHKGRS